MRNESRLKKLETELSGDGEEVVVIGVDWGSPETDTVTFVQPAELAGKTILLSEFNRLFPDCKVHRVEYEDTERTPEEN